MHLGSPEIRKESERLTPLRQEETDLRPILIAGLLKICRLTNRIWSPEDQHNESHCERISVTKYPHNESQRYTAEGRLF